MKRFETSVFVMSVYDDSFIEFVVKKDVMLDSEDLWDARRLSLEYLPGKKFGVLTEAQDMLNITKEARETGASKEYAKDLYAVALYSKNFSLKLLGNLYIKINKPIVPTRLFDDRKKAEEWLRGLMPKQQAI
jgi:hypothetical protein